MVMSTKNNQINVDNNKHKSLTVTQQHFVSTPLPPPEWLEKFNKIYPDAAKEIFEDFKKVSEVNSKVVLERVKNETKLVELKEKELNNRKISQIQAFVIAILLLGCSIFCIKINKGEYVKYFLGLSAVGIVSTLINKDKK